MRFDLLAMVLIVVGAAVFVLASTAFSEPVMARSIGIVGYSSNPDAGGGANCTECHGGGAPVPTTSITVPQSVIGGESVDVTVTIAGGPAAVGGFNASVASFFGDLIADDIETQIINNEITHVAPKAFVQGEVSFTFQWVPPVEAGVLELYASGLSANQNNNNQGDGVHSTAVVVDVIAGDVLGDVNCTGTVDIVDALFISQFTAVVRDDVVGCPLVEPTTQLDSSRGDVNLDQTTDIVDALFIAQCTAGISNAFCPV